MLLIDVSRSIWLANEANDNGNFEIKVARPLAFRVRLKEDTVYDVLGELQKAIGITHYVFQGSKLLKSCSQMAIRRVSSNMVDVVGYLGGDKYSPLERVCFSES